MPRLLHCPFRWKTCESENNRVCVKCDRFDFHKGELKKSLKFLFSDDKSLSVIMHAHLIEPEKHA